MNSKQKHTEVEEDTKFDIIDKDDVEIFENIEDLVSDIIEDVEMLLPAMNVSSEMPYIDKEPCIVTDENLLSDYEEIMANCRKDREQADEILTNFLDMVINNGDASSASKEAIVNLLRIKSDTSDKMAKIADLKTRIKMKDKDTFPRYLAAQQNNKVVIEGNRRDLIKKVNDLKNKGNDNES